MIKNDGRMNFTGIFIILLICYGAFVAYKFITVRVGKVEIKNEVVNQLGTMRGQDFTVEAGIKAIHDILIARHVVTAEERVRVDTEGEDGLSTSYLNEIEDDTQKSPPRVTILLKFTDNRAKLRFRITYDVVIDLILFKNKQEIVVEDEVLTYS